MELLQLLLPALFFVSVFSLEGMVYVNVVLGKQFSLGENCKSDEEGTLRQDRPQSRNVAARRSGVWTPEESFKDRINQSSSVVFNRAVYTDTGVYVLKCGGQEVDIQVEVVVSSDKTVKEGKAVRLPCYYLTTAAGTCWTVRWTKGREDVLRWSSCGDKSNWTADARLSLSAAWLSHGDLSLNLQSAQKDDEGDYFCFIEAKGGLYQNGIPGAASLEVDGAPDQITSTSPPPPPVSPTQKPGEEMGTAAAVAITAVVCLIIGAVIGWLISSYSSRCLSRRPREEGPAAGHDHVNEVLQRLKPHEQTNGFPRPSG